MTYMIPEELASWLKTQIWGDFGKYKYDRVEIDASDANKVREIIRLLENSQWRSFVNPPEVSGKYEVCKRGYDGNLYAMTAKYNAARKRAGWSKSHNQILWWRPLDLPLSEDRFVVVHPSPSKP